MRRGLTRLFPGATDEGATQASSSAPADGHGWRRASDVAIAANIAALTAMSPLIRRIAEDATRAGLVPEGIVEAALDQATKEVGASFVATRRYDGTARVDTHAGTAC